MRLSVLGPQLDRYERRKEVLRVAEYILENNEHDAKLRGFAEDVNLSSLAFLFSDLKLEPNTTWPLFGAALLRSQQHSVICYPALVTGLDMYGSQLRNAMEGVEVQGGMELFHALAVQER